ncbi:aldehyde dehydrogenase family protein [Paraburkholderia sp. RL17-373-BIF-A]|uniref:aldehyde dehydrogenase family protein n=1 Tax=Paraburkholderia sp. RL17-373-BIF-A TaxID=3031629 RepID=UPI0038BD1A83
MRTEQAKTFTAEDFRRHAAVMKPETRMLIDGELLESASGERFESTNPATGKVAATVPAGTIEDVNRAVISARRAFRSGAWSRREPRSRMEVLYRFAKLIEDHALEFSLLDSMDVGKPVTDMLSGDVPAAALTFQYFGETIDKIEGTITSTAADAFHYIVREPLGVVACITPWNYPLLMNAWKVAPALAVGNSVVLKPAELSPLSATLLAQLFIEAGGPEGVFNVVHGTGSTAGKALALHMDVDKISFTGSTDVGKLMMVYAGQSNLKRVTVETGGKSPHIITSSVPDLDVAVDYAISGIYVNKGEVCSAGSRILVDASIEKDFVERFKARVHERVRLGDPLDPKTTMGPQASHCHQQKILDYVRIGVQEGAQVVLGGRMPRGFDEGAYVEPTLLTGVNNRMRIAREEIFGPVGVVIPFSTIDEAVAIANDSTFGLAAGVWTSDLSMAHKMARNIQAGVIWVNCYDHGDMTQPWGGFKQSGTGRDKCLETLLTVSQTKSVWMHLGY